MQRLSDFQELYLRYLADHPFAAAPRELYEPADYIMSLGGKRLRPVLALLGYALFQEDARPALPIAHAVEVFHNFTLVHDDIMDAAPLRRGKPTVHHKYSVNTGILSGDVMLIAAYDSLLQFGNRASIPDLLQVFTTVAREVCEGQQLDVNFENRTDVQIAEYIRMIELKTAVLLAGSLQMGAIGAGASTGDAKHLAEFGRNIGIAFQLQDDLLDTFGEEAKVGKMIGGDIAQNKKTYLILRAQELASPEQREELSHWMGSTPDDPTTKITSVTSLLKELGIPAEGTAIKQRYQDLAMDHLAAVQRPEPAKQHLREFADLLFQRDH